MQKILAVVSIGLLVALVGFIGMPAKPVKAQTFITWNGSHIIVAGTVVDANGNPYRGAKLSLAEEQPWIWRYFHFTFPFIRRQAQVSRVTFSRRDGTFRMELNQQDVFRPIDDKYLIIFRSRDNQTTQQEVTLLPGQTVKLTITLDDQQLPVLPIPTFIY